MSLPDMFFAMIVLVYILRIYCVWVLKTRGPELYEQLGRPAFMSRYSCSFIYRALRQPQFRQLGKPAWYAFRAAQVLDVVLIAVTIGLAIQMFHMRGAFEKLFTGNT